MKKIFVFCLIVFALAGCGDEADVEQLDNGLQYVNDTTGTGKTAEMGNLVAVHFKAWVIQDSANLFEDWTNDSLNARGYIGSSKDRNTPVKFFLGSGDFIKGIDEGIEGMQVGGTRTIIIPSYLAYGPQGYGPIPPDADLKIVVELLDASERVEVKQWEADSSKVKTTKSGLKYIVIEEGNGEKADTGDVVDVHYTGWFTNGERFDSSVERDEPITFTLGKKMVIAGWEEGITLLKEGAKAKFIIPPSLAYGEQGRGKIPPNSTLIFDIELVDVK